MDGQKLGVARAIIELATEKFSQSRQVIMRESQQIERSVDSIGTSIKNTEQIASGSLARIANNFRDASKAAEAFDKTPTGGILKGLNSVQVAVAGVTEAMGAMTVMGTGFAREIRQTEVQFRVLLGSQQRASAENEEGGGFRQARQRACARNAQRRCGTDSHLQINRRRDG